MNKEELAALGEAWELRLKIVKDIAKLAAYHPSLAYGCIQEAEVIVDTIMFGRLQEAKKISKNQQEVK